MQFSVERHLLQYFAAIGLECRAEIVNIDAAELGHQPVGTPRREAAQPEVVYSILAPAADDVVSLGNLLQENRDVGWIMLQVAIHGDDVFATGMVKAGSKARGLPKVAA